MKKYFVTFENIEWKDDPEGYYSAEFPKSYDATLIADTVSEAIDRTKKFAEDEHDWIIITADIRAVLAAEKAAVTK